MNSTIGYVDSTFKMGIPSDEDFNIIKTMLPSDDVNKDSLFTYKVVLCDNKVDRDIEMFSSNALDKLATMFNGVIGILDHEPSSMNNHSRIYKAEHVIDKDNVNDFGDAYEYVLAYAYTIINEKNKPFIDELKAGLKKEVSIGFDKATRVCNICNSMNKECEHTPGQYYDITNDNKLCVKIINDVDDVYEWSFVSIPAQRAAGIIKNYNKNKEDEFMDIKALSAEIASNLDETMSKKLMDMVNELSKPDNEKINTLDSRVKALEADIIAKDVIIKELEDKEEERILEEAINTIFDELVPLNDTMKNIALKEIDDILVVDNGEIVGLEDALKKLKSDEYKPLFVDGADDSGSNTEDDEKDANINIVGATKNKVDFTRVSNIKNNNKLFSNKSVGIKTVI